MKDFELDVQLRKMLHECVDDLQTDDAFKEEIDDMIQNNKNGKKKIAWRKLMIGLTAAACLATIGVAARGQVAGLASSRWMDDQQHSVSDLQKDAAVISKQIQVPEKLQDHAFERGSVEYIEKLDETGKTLGKYPELVADYGKKGEISLYAHVWDEEVDGAEFPEQHYEGQPRETREINGVTVSYQMDRYLFVPPEYQPTKEEQQQVENNTLYISYGSAEKEEQFFQYIKWQIEDVVYGIYTYDTEITAEDLFAAAEDVMQA